MQLRKMAPNSVRFAVEPRDVPVEKAARRLHLTLLQFRACEHELYARGFPHPDKTTGMFDLHAIDRWMDTRAAGVMTGAVGTPAVVDARDVFAERVRRLSE